MTKRILVVEDQEDNRRILRDLLTSVGYELIEAVTGSEGVRLAEAHRPDLILMDIQLPELDGHEATRRIKADPRAAPDPDHRRHLLRAERRRGQGAGGRRRRLRHQAVQPAPAAGQGARAAGEISGRYGGTAPVNTRAAARSPQRVLPLCFSK